MTQQLLRDDPVRDPDRLGWDCSHRLQTILDRSLTRMLRRPDISAIDDLARHLGRLFDEAKDAGRAPEFKAICRAHPLAQVILEDPYSRRAFEKPRGYAGDAVMLDYIYQPSRPNCSALGKVIHQATTRLPTALSVLWRRDYLAARIQEVIELHPNGRILSVASGHMRELDRVREASRVGNLEIWALDQDREALHECLRSYGDLNIHQIHRSISAILRNELPVCKLDLVYCAGLADYLPDNLLGLMLHRLHGRLRDGGLLTVGNFAPDNHGRGFMEGFMDWSLTYRDEDDLTAIVEESLPTARYRLFRDGPGNVVYLEITR